MIAIEAKGKQAWINAAFNDQACIDPCAGGRYAEEVSDILSALTQLEARAASLAKVIESDA